VSYELNGVSTILGDNSVPIRLFGQHFTNQTVVRFVKDVKSRGADCDDMEATEAHPVIKIFYQKINMITSSITPI